MTPPRRQVDVHELAGTRYAFGVWIASCTCTWESAGYLKEKRAIAHLDRHIEKEAKRQ
ncbi:hypothetical protein NWFMUON74_61150 [Nocardia wallacei]|uniref:Uncharacterized protein n=1 Tax=Nocardia wallacei TaxID=480035 RepID=A0A7G1KVY3_9NOCA|nr:hypothetical protein NWFMUON74_61150 [Nocardia wallacei]